MDTDATKRTWVALVLAAIVVVILYFTVPPVPMTPQGIVLPTGEPLPATATTVPTAQIQLFTTETAPLSYQALGQINIEYHAAQDVPEAQITLAQYARTLASTVKANGVIVTIFGHTAGKVPASQAFYVLQGTAIYFLGE